MISVGSRPCAANPYDTFLPTVASFEKYNGCCLYSYLPSSFCQISNFSIAAKDMHSFCEMYTIIINCLCVFFAADTIITKKCVCKTSLGSHGIIEKRLFLRGIFFDVFIALNIQRSRICLHLVLIGQLNRQKHCR